MDVSIIIVNYNTCDITSNCIDSICQHTSNISYEIILVDNNSIDRSKEIFSNDLRIKYLYQTSNLGFGKANNIGANIAQGKYLFFLNSDTILISNIIKEFYEYLEKHHYVASCGCNLINEKGENTVSHGKFPSIFQEFSDIGFARFYRNYYNENLSLGQLGNEGNWLDVDYISGADIFIKKEIFNNMNGFDTDFFMYYEETDLFFRMKKRGLKSCLLNNHSLIHLGGGSFNSNPQKQINTNKLNIEFKSKYLYYKKNFSKNIIPFIKLLHITNILLHAYKYKNHTAKILQIIINS